MAGRGPAPKSPERRGGHSPKDPVPLRVILAEPTEQPGLPPLLLKNDDQFVQVDWPAVTLDWWAMWAESPLSRDFTATDWSELRDTARLHALFWMGDKSVAPEMRLRVAKFGATPEDRARLRITFAAADEADEKRPVIASSARERRGALQALPASE